MCVGGTGFIILIASRNAALSYFAVYLAACGVYPCVPNVIAWMSNNFEGSYKRGVATGMLISWGNLNGAVSSNVVCTIALRLPLTITDHGRHSTAHKMRRGIRSGTGSC